MHNAAGCRDSPTLGRRQRTARREADSGLPGACRGQLQTSVLSWKFICTVRGASKHAPTGVVAFRSTAFSVATRQRTTVKAAVGARGKQGGGVRRAQYGSSSNWGAK